MKKYQELWLKDMPNNLHKVIAEIIADDTGTTDQLTQALANQAQVEIAKKEAEIEELKADLKKTYILHEKLLRMKVDRGN